LFKCKPKSVRLRWLFLLVVMFFGGIFLPLDSTYDEKTSRAAVKMPALV